MPHRGVIVILACGLMSLLLSGLISCKRHSAGPPAPEVVVYCSVDQEIAEPILQEFEKSCGIKVRARFDTEASKTVGLVQRLRAEAATPAADVFWSGEIFHTLRLAREGLLAEYAAPVTAERPASFRDPAGRWHGLALRARVIVYNTQHVPAAEAPRALEDLLAPRWRGRLVLAAPEFGTTGGDIASWFAHYGPERARQILRQLKENQVRLAPGNSTVVRLVATGQADVGCTDTDDVYAGQRNGWPVAFHYLDQNGAGPLVIPNTVALVRGGPHPEPAGRLIDYLLSAEVERRLVESDSHNTPVHAALAKEYPAYQIPTTLSLDYEKIADQLPSAIQAAGEILR